MQYLFAIGPVRLRSQLEHNTRTVNAPCYGGAVKIAGRIQSEVVVGPLTIWVPAKSMQNGFFPRAAGLMGQLVHRSIGIFTANLGASIQVPSAVENQAAPRELAVEPVAEVIQYFLNPGAACLRRGQLEHGAAALWSAIRAAVGCGAVKISVTIDGQAHVRAAPAFAGCGESVDGLFGPAAACDGS